MTTTQRATDTGGSSTEQGRDEWLSDFDRHEGELVTLTTRIPKDLFFELKLRALRSTVQILTEHAYTLYLGGRLPPDLWGGYEWPEEFPLEPKPAYLSSSLRGFSVRIPRTLLRWARVFAVEADMSDQELAVRVFDWYVRKELIPPDKRDVRREASGRLIVNEPLIANKFWGRSTEQIMEALSIMVDRHSKYGGPLASQPTSLMEEKNRPSPSERVNAKRRRRSG
jgi:hypothetical protein